MRELIDYIEALTLTQGRFEGQPFRLHQWEKRFIRGAFSIDGDAGLSVARGNGKSTLIAAICCAALDGPLVVNHAETVVAASSFDQGRIIFDHVLAFMGDKLADRKRWRVQDSSNRAIITCRQTGASVRCIGSDPKRMHGLAPRLLIGDELAQWELTKIDKALAALQTSMGKIPHAKAVWIGTRADQPDHPFERILNGGVEYSQVHSTPREAPPFQKRSWQKANPGLRHLPDLEAAIRKEAVRARKDPMALASFRALRLNQGVNDTLEAVLCSAETWRDAEATEPMRDGPFVLGLDLGQNASLSGVAAYWLRTSYCEAFAVLPHYPDLHSRGLADGVGGLYTAAAERGEIFLAGDRVADIPGLLGHALALWGAPEAISCDRWRIAELVQSLEAVGFPDCQISERGQGYKDGAEDMRLFRAALLDGQLHSQRGLLNRASVGGGQSDDRPGWQRQVTQARRHDLQG